MSTASPEPTHEQVQTLMAGYVLNALSAEETAEFESYLQQDPELVQQVQEYQALMGLLPHTVQQPAPEHLRNKILAISNPAQPKRLFPFRQRSWFPISWTSIGGAIAAITLLVLGIQNYSLQQKLRFLEAEMEELQEQETFSFDLRGTKAAVDASASVILDLRGGKALIAVQNLPSLPEGEAYYLWAFTADEKIFCGRFNTSTSGQSVSQFSIPSEEYKSDVQFMRVAREPITPFPDPSQQTFVMTSES